jgi:transcriptional regulator with XRE-family HTH domain
MKRRNHAEHKAIEMPADRSSLLRRGFQEPDGCLSVGGLARSVDYPASIVGVDAARISLARFVELLRRKLGLSLEELAECAGIGLPELLAIESAQSDQPTSDTLERLAAAFGIKSAALLALAGHARRSGRIGNAAVRFAARSEPNATLAPHEEIALSEFMRELAKC